MNKAEYTQVAYDEMDKWGLVALGWTIVHSYAIQCAGMCVYENRTIRLSAPIFNKETDAFVLDTIRHEIAHALDTSKDKPHGKTWQRLAVQVGADPTATFDSAVVNELVLLNAKYVMAFGNKIVQTYQRKPNKKTIANIKDYWARGHKSETHGKLTIQVYDSRIHMEYI